MIRSYLIDKIEKEHWRDRILELCAKHGIEISYTRGLIHFDDKVNRIRLNRAQLEGSALELRANLGDIVAFTLAHEIGHYYDFHDLNTDRVSELDQLQYLGSVRELTPLLECEIRCWKIGKELLNIEKNTLYMRYASRCVNSHARHSPEEYDFQREKRLAREAVVNS